MARSDRQVVRMRQRSAFTLVELLVVIGIIALLISILLPVLGRARESANQVKCLSNMKQVGMAIIAFANDNKGRMPSQAGFGQARYFNSSGGFSAVSSDTDPMRMQLSDWISWHRKIDPISGATNSQIDANITYGATARYMNIKLKETTGGAAANALSAQFEAIYRCPSDTLDFRGSPAAQGAYRYSFSMNNYITGDSVNQTYLPPTAYGPYTQVPRGQRNGFIFKGKISDIRQPGQVILLVDEDPKTIDDGNCVARWDNWLAGTSVNTVSDRHDIKSRRAGTVSNPQPTQNATGNVVYVDGHGGQITRKDAVRARHTGNPYVEPSNF